MNICESLTVPAGLFPERTAIIFDDVRLTYADLDQKTVQAADILAANGVRPNDRVALMLPNAPSFAVWYYAALRLGAIAVSVSTRLAEEEVKFIAEDCQAIAFVGSVANDASVLSSLPASVETRITVNDADGSVTDLQSGTTGQTPMDARHESSWHNANPDDPALILYTSGTTGFPKGATLSHGNVRSNVHSFNHLCNMQTDDRVLVAVPLFHCFGQNALLNSVLNVGGTIILQKRFDLNESIRLITQHQVTQLYGVPMMFGLLLDACQPENLTSVQYCFSAAATLPNQTADAWQDKFGMPIHQGYGLTETSPFATYNHRLKFVPGSIGTAIDSVEIKVVDTETGSQCPSGELGEIAIRGPNVMLGYWNRPGETEAAIREGWFFSGDIGRLDQNGYLYIVDRVKDMITVGGLKVFPAEVERVLLDHPAVSQAAVVGVPDPLMGEQVIGYLVFQTENDGQQNDPHLESQRLAEVQQYARSRLGSYKLPRRLVAIPELPRNPSGKILKTKLRDLAAENQDITNPNHENSTVPVSSLDSPTLANTLSAAHASEKIRVASRFLCQHVQTLTESKSLPEPQQTFIEAGLDSLGMVSLSAQLQVEVGPTRPLPPTLLFDYPQIGDLARFVVEMIDGPASLNSGDLSANDVATGGSVERDQPAKSNTEQDVHSMTEEEALSELMKEIQ